MCYCLLEIYLHYIGLWVAVLISFGKFWKILQSVVLGSVGRVTLNTTICLLYLEYQRNVMSLICGSVCIVGRGCVRGSFSPEKCLRPLTFCLKIVSFSKIRTLQSDQSLPCPHEGSLGPQLPTERTAKTLIRLGGCTG